MFVDNFTRQESQSQIINFKRCLKPHFATSYQRSTNKFLRSTNDKTAEARENLSKAYYDMYLGYRESDNVYFTKALVFV